MEVKDVLMVSGALIVSLGGGFGVVLSLSSWLGKVWANRLMARDTATHAQELATSKKNLEEDIESYKIRLKKSEFIFQKEFEAASEFVGMLRNFEPLRSRPQMDLNDACDDIAQNLGEIEEKLKTFLTKHGAVLQKETKEAICTCIGIAGEHKFMNASPDVPCEANEAACNLYQRLYEVEECLLKQVHSQAST